MRHSAIKAAVISPILRAVALIAVVAGAAGSLVFMLRAGHPPVFLRVLFAGWVLLPFAALVLADVVARRNGWPALTRTTLHGVMLLVTLASLAIYANVALGPPRPKPAFWFLVVPLASWLLIVGAVSIAAFASGKRSRRGAGG